MRPTVDDEARSAGVGGAKVVGDDALVAALVSEGDVPQVQDGGVFHHAAGHLRSRPLLVGDVLHFGVVQGLLVFAPGEGHWGGAAAGHCAREAHVTAQDGHRGLRLHRDLRLREVVWRRGRESKARGYWRWSRGCRRKNRFKGPL